MCAVEAQRCVDCVSAVLHAVLRVQRLLGRFSTPTGVLGVSGPVAPLWTNRLTCRRQRHDLAAVARSIVTTAPLNGLPAQDLRYRFVAQLHLGVDPHPNPVDTATAKTTTRPESRWKAFTSSLAMTRTPPR
jgi:hypothetical protein